MKQEMIEALRLTREGRLAEAGALIRRALAKGRAPGGPQAHVVEVPPLPAESGNGAEAPTQGPPGLGATQTSEKVPDDTASSPRVTVHPAPGYPFTLPDLKPMGGLTPDVLAKLAAHGPPLRQVPAERVAPAAGRWVAGAYTGQAGTRAYKLYIPGAHQGRPLPLIVMLHGCTQSPDDFAAGTRMNFLAEAGGFLVVYPEQAATANISRCWNWFQAAHQRRDQGEPSLIAGITRQVMAERQVDAGRVYVAGLSAGGAMAAIMAAAYPDLYAAVGVHSGLAPGNAHDLPSALQAMQHGGPRARSAAGIRTVPLILFQGDQDSTVHPRNAEEFIRQWASGPDQPQVTLRLGQVPGGRAYTCAVYQDLSGQAVVERWTVHGAGHAWSGGSSNGSFTDPAGPDASQELARFFQEHPRRTAAAPQPTQWS
jgi:poly(hydroxyalkanoate) depolymerase family esterase